MTARDATALRRLTEAMLDPGDPVKVDTATWARTHLAQRDVVADDANSTLALDDWRRCGERGIFRLLVPTELGGTGADLATVLLTLEGLGQGCADNGLTYAAASQMLSTQIALARFGSPEQCERWLPGLLDGTSFAAFAMTEPNTGSDAFALEASARRRDDGAFVLTGHKAYITFGPVCDMAIVFASTRPDAGSWGISAFVVDTTTDGVTRSAVRGKMGMRTTPFGDLVFDEVVLPPTALLGREGAGARIFGSVLDVERSYVFAPQVGAMERQLDEAIAYAKQRVQGGRPIGHHQAVAHRIVAMKERHERARLYLYRAAMAEATGRHVTMYASLAKLVAGEVGIESALDASMVQGARGYLTEFEIERNLRDAVGGLTYSGTPDVMRNVIARHLGLG
jgi:alkylation response protein AidB-like acyl-CoA dehydrogenase